MNLIDIKGVGSKNLKYLNDEGIYTSKDLIYYFPKEYIYYEEDKNYFMHEEKCLVLGMIKSSPYFIKLKNRANAIIFYIDCYGYKLKCLYFGLDYLKYKMHANDKLSLYGRFDKTKKEFIVSKIFFGYIENTIEVDYKIKNISNKIYSNMIKSVFLNNIDLTETLPKELLDKYKLKDISSYLYLSHFPSSKEDVRQVIRRRKYEEMFWYSVRLRMLKENILNNPKKKREIYFDYHDKFLSLLPYSLTLDQITAINEIKDNILSKYIMNRLVQGDVSCGKSVVAFYAAIFEVSCKMQSLILAPTQILATQHYNKLLPYASKLGIRIKLLTSATRQAERKQIIDSIKNGGLDILIGTHSILNDNISYNNLGLLIIDEQHKFGVMQRSKLLNKYKGSDALYMSATPIPRTLGLTSLGDLDITSIKTMPSKRKEIKTKIVSYDKINGVLKFIKKEVELSHQVYVICPLIEDNLDNKYHTVVDAKEYIDSINLKSVILTGKNKNQDKDMIMESFKRKEFDVLIATTIVEVGIDNTNASTIVIFDANMFGLSVLHQLRGRVGRGSLDSYCILLTNDIENKRLKALEEYGDGFNISEIDFKERGAGDFFGNMQSGFVNLEYSSIVDDASIWECAKNDATIYLKKFMNGEIISDEYNNIVLLNKGQNGKIN